MTDAPTSTDPTQRAELLDQVFRRFAPEAPRRGEHPALAQLEDALALTQPDTSEIDRALALLNRDGYLAGGLIRLALRLQQHWDPRIAIRLVRELSDGIDVQLGLTLGDLIAADPGLEQDKFSQRSGYMDVHLALADALHHSGHSDRAIRHYEAVLGIDIHHRGALRGWSDAMAIEQDLGRDVAIRRSGSTLVDGIEELKITASLDTGRYELGRPLGRGRHAIVYQAYDRRVGRDVAIKQLLSHANSDGAATSAAVERRFLAEAQTLARVRSRHVVPLYDMHPQGRYIAMELCRAGSLRQLLRRRQIQTEHVHEIARQLEIALRAVHGSNAVHRDIKPANILVRRIDPQPEIVLADFGLAVGGPRQHKKAAGTLRYLAPELRRGERATAQSDLFSAGVVLLEIALAPHPLPRALDQLETPQNPELLLEQEAVPPALRERLIRLLDPEPERRAWIS